MLAFLLAAAVPAADSDALRARCDAEEVPACLELSHRLAIGELGEGRIDEALAISRPLCARPHQLACQLVLLEDRARNAGRLGADDLGDLRLACRAGFDWACERSVALADDPRKEARLACKAQHGWWCRRRRAAPPRSEPVAAEVRALLDRVGLRVDLPPRFEWMPPPVDNPHLAVALSMRAVDAPLELHVHVFDIAGMREAMPACGEGVVCTDPNQLYEANFMVGALNLSGGATDGGSPFPPLAVLLEFDAQWGASSSFALAPGFSDRSRALMVTLHRDERADVTLVWAFDDYDRIEPLFEESFHAVGFADPLGPEGRSMAAR